MGFSGMEALPFDLLATERKGGRLQGRLFP